MNRKLLLASVLIILLCIAGYNYKIILLYTFGFRTPKLESNESVKKFYYDNNDINGELFSYKDSASFKGLNKLGIPAVLIFDKNKQLICSGKGEGCVNKAKDFIKTLNAQKTYAVDRAFGDSIYNYIRSSIMPIGNNSETNPSPDYNFVVVYAWAKFLPSHSKRFFEINKDVPRGLNVKIISINLDFNRDVLGSAFKIPELEF